LGFLIVSVAGAALGFAIAYLPIFVVAGLMIAAMAAIAMMTRPFLCLILYTIVFMMRPGELYPALAPLQLEKLVGGAALITLFLAQFRHHGRVFLDTSRQSLLLYAFVVSIVVSVPFAFWRSAALDGLIEALKVLAFYAMVVQFVDTRSRLRKFVWVYGLLNVYITVDAIVTYGTGGAKVSQGIERIYGQTSAIGHPNFLGATMAATFPLFFLMTFNKSLGRWRPLMLLSAIAMVVTLVLTGSRGALIGFLATLACMWWSSRHRLRYGVLGLCILLVSVSLVPQQYKMRYATMASTTIDESSKGRIEAWKVGLRMMMDKPVFGIGINNFSAAHFEYSGSWLNAHSLFLQVLAELGLLGAAVYFAFLHETLRLNRRAYRLLGEHGDEWSFERTVLDGVFVGLVALLVCGLFGDSPMRRTYYIFAGTGLAVVRIYGGRLDRTGASHEDAHGLLGPRVEV
jgi:probable O-glycosylation ligase (exosortase A-associated)